MRPLHLYEATHPAKFRIEYHAVHFKIDIDFRLFVYFSLFVYLDQWQFMPSNEDLKRKKHHAINRVL